MTPTAAQAVMDDPQPPVNEEMQNAASTTRVFLPLVNSGAATTSNLVRSASSNDLRLCFNNVDKGQQITGRIGDKSVSYWAGTFKVSANDVAMQAFCTDIHNGIQPGKCYEPAVFEEPNAKVACTLQYYPPSNLSGGLSNVNQEAAARQAAIWHFSDGFQLASSGYDNSANIFSRYQTIVADIAAKMAKGQCASVQPTNYQVILTPGDNTLWLDAIEGGYLAAGRPYTVTVMKTEGNAPQTPVAGIAVQITTTLGKLSANGQAQTTALTVTTDANGQAFFTVTHDRPGTAQISASITVASPRGVKINPGSTVQKLVLDSTEKLRYTATAVQQWRAKGSLKVTKIVEWGKVTPDQNKTFEICIQGNSSSTPICKQLGYSGGELVWNNLTPDVYTVWESYPGAQWSVTGNKVNVIVNEGNQTHHTITNVNTSNAAPEPTLTCERIIVNYHRPLTNGDHINMTIRSGTGEFQVNAYVDLNIAGGYNGMGLRFSDGSTRPLTQTEVQSGVIDWAYPTHARIVALNGAPFEVIFLQANQHDSWPGLHCGGKPTPVTPEPTPITPEPTPVTPEPTPVTPEPTPVTPEPTPVTPEPTP
ncbi:MAG: Cys-Gln thioester bond-forming surface protein, partial [Caldilinea sp.]|nr:Cys-Gln thioester bond-forming surface protein [Caldilinea sp.]MDW8441361.1 Cys-Gln thioester bond-forming surface protein [Caldilineaceae bacterium]